jgi:nicotinamide mononucleotide transporter
MMNWDSLLQQFIEGMKATTWLEYIAVFMGIISVWLEKKENIFVFPIGLINTIIYVWISIQGNLFGEASVNFYYTVVGIYGWILWSKKDAHQHQVVNIQFSNAKQWMQQILFFLFFYAVIFFILTYLKRSFAPNAIPWADAFASASAYTGMWLLAKKKIESWYWWIATNLASIPLYFVKDYVFISVYYVVILIMSFFGLVEWIKKANYTHRASLNVKPV